MVSVTSLKKERKTWTVAYSEFLEDFDKSNPSLFYGFVEGKADIAYYQSAIQSCLSPTNDIQLYNANGKPNIKRIYDKLHTDSCYYPCNRITYYIDRDLSPIVSDPNLIIASDTYITDQYSIENDILTADIFIRSLCEVVGFETLTCNKKNELRDRYLKQRKLFEKMMIPLMAHLILWKQESCFNEYTSNNLKLKKHILFDNDKNVSLNMSDIIEALYSSIKKEDPSTIYQSSLKEIEETIIEQNLEGKILRGHFLAMFFIQYCNYIANNSSIFDLPQKKTREISEFDIGLAIAPRCTPPQSLLDFINKNMKRI